MDAVLFIAITASWCGPCQQLHKDFESDARIAWVDVDARPDVAKQHRVTTYPTVVAMRDGKEIGRHAGYRGRREMERWLTSMEATAVRRRF